MKTYKIIILIITVIYIGLFAGGCNDENDPIIPPADHFEPEGIIITSSGDTVVYYFQGTVRAEDTLKAPTGNDLSPHYTLRFIDADRSQISPPSSATHSLGWTIAHNNIAELYRDPGDEWNFHIRGKDSGTTTITFKVMHGGHADFTTSPIPVHADPSFAGDAAGILILDEESGDTLVLANSQYTVGSLSAREDSITDHIVIYFLDDEGIMFQPPVPPHSMGYQILNADIAEIIPAGPAEPWAFQLLGKETGNTIVRLSILISGTAEYTSPDIDVIISP